MDSITIDKAILILLRHILVMDEEDPALEDVSAIIHGIEVLHPEWLEPEKPLIKVPRFIGEQVED